MAGGRKLYSLIRVGEDTWYAPTPTNIGIFRYSGREVCMIDAGLPGHSRGSSGAGKIPWLGAEKAVPDALPRRPRSRSRVPGGSRPAARSGAPGISAAAVEHSFLIPVTLFGGSTTPEMCSRLLTPPPCACSELSGDALPPGLDFDAWTATTWRRRRSAPGTACGSRRTR